MSITPHFRSIKDLLQTRSFGIDEYQREYKWESSNVEELINDLLGKFESSYRLGDVPRKAEEYGDYSPTTTASRPPAPSKLDVFR